MVLAVLIHTFMPAEDIAPLVEHVRQLLITWLSGIEPKEVAKASVTLIDLAAEYHALKTVFDLLHSSVGLPGPPSGIRASWRH
jgi:hypothetical protein